MNYTNSVSNVLEFLKMQTFLVNLKGIFVAKTNEKNQRVSLGRDEHSAISKVIFNHTMVHCDKLTQVHFSKTGLLLTAQGKELSIALNDRLV